MLSERTRAADATSALRNPRHRVPNRWRRTLVGLNEALVSKKALPCLIQDNNDFDPACRVEERSQAARSFLASGEVVVKGGRPMISAWWLLAAFLGGGCAGVLLVALMQMAGGLPEPSPHAPDLHGQPW
jgi:hypothetical protein